MKKILVIFVLLLAGCINVPENITPVDNFNIERYLGKWYEIARLDHSFERGLSRSVLNIAYGPMAVCGL